MDGAGPGGSRITGILGPGRLWLRLPDPGLPARLSGPRIPVPRSGSGLPAGLPGRRLLAAGLSGHRRLRPGWRSDGAGRPAERRLPAGRLRRQPAQRRLPLLLGRLLPAAALLPAESAGHPIARTSLDGHRGRCRGLLDDRHWRLLGQWCAAGCGGRSQGPAAGRPVRQRPAGSGQRSARGPAGREEHHGVHQGDCGPGQGGGADPGRDLQRHRCRNRDDPDLRRQGAHQLPRGCGHRQGRRPGSHYREHVFGYGSWLRPEQGRGAAAAEGRQRSGHRDRRQQRRQHW